MNMKLRRFYENERPPFTANEIRVAGLLFTQKGREYSEEAVSFYAGVHELQVQLIVDRLREKGVHVCTRVEKGELYHYAPKEKWWHYVAAAAIISPVLYTLLWAFFQ